MNNPSITLCLGLKRCWRRPAYTAKSWMRPYKQRNTSIQVYWGVVLLFIREGYGLISDIRVDESTRGSARMTWRVMLFVESPGGILISQYEMVLSLDIVPMLSWYCRSRIPQGCITTGFEQHPRDLCVLACACACACVYAYACACDAANGTVSRPKYELFNHWPYQKQREEIDISTYCIIPNRRGTSVPHSAHRNRCRCRSGSGLPLGELTCRSRVQQ
jgi:hypothetical protein